MCTSYHIRSIYRKWLKLFLYPLTCIQVQYTSLSLDLGMLLTLSNAYAPVSRVLWKLPLGQRHQFQLSVQAQALRASSGKGCPRWPDRDRFFVGVGRRGNAKFHENPMMCTYCILFSRSPTSSIWSCSSAIPLASFPRDPKLPRTPCGTTSLDLSGRTSTTSTPTL